MVTLSEVDDLVQKKARGCPLEMTEGVCYDHVWPETQPSCAWWIPGAKCCAIVQIARKLSTVSYTLFETGRFAPSVREDIPF